MPEPTSFICFVYEFASKITINSEEQTMSWTTEALAILLETTYVPLGHGGATGYTADERIRSFMVDDGSEAQGVRVNLSIDEARVLLDEFEQILSFQRHRASVAMM
jgi:hypothetical protein